MQKINLLVNFFNMNLLVNVFVKYIHLSHVSTVCKKKKKKRLTPKGVEYTYYYVKYFNFIKNTKLFAILPLILFVLKLIHVVCLNLSVKFLNKLVLQNKFLLCFCTWFSKRMNHHNGCWLDHVAMDTLQLFASTFVHTPELLVLPIRNPQPLLKHCEIKRSTWIKQDGWRKDRSSLID